MRKRRTHCAKRGHRYTDETTLWYVRPNGNKERRCRLCAAIDEKARVKRVRDSRTPLCTGHELVRLILQKQTEKENAPTYLRADIEAEMRDLQARLDALQEQPPQHKVTA